ncbi:MAG: hypothetical protein LM550_11810 [Candidatus Contendobacter sp.]|jgi:translation elongation factor EF-G|nr:hypothetical protein [Gammaproteobacteria bacterium]MCC8994347.1 hypothetical protein [Candidatus Contendobacter sp.]
MGELHLQIASERLKREFSVNLRVGKPLKRAHSQFHRVMEQPDGKKLEIKVGARVVVELLTRGAEVNIEVTPQQGRRVAAALLIMAD